MKLNISMFRKLLLLLVMVCTFTISQAQEKVVTGTVTDANDGMGIPGVSVVVKGTTVGTSTDIDGNFTISASANSTLVFSFIGYKGQEILVGDQTQLNIVLSTDTENLSEVVVIGYGQVKKEDATGSVVALNEDDFNKGAVASPEQLLTGRTAGVRIVSGGGAPGSGQTIRIRGAASLSSSNNPLIVIDGIPVDDSGVSGMRNPLNTINPNDIATFSILKDASAAAIYGSRASNGVIIITTKKGKMDQPLKFAYNGSATVSYLKETVDALSANEFRSVINENGTAAQQALMGDANTNWQDEVFQTALSQDHNFSATGTIKDVPFRASFGYSDQEGILKTSEMQRTTASFGIRPSLFDDHLRIDMNVKGAIINNRFADTGAIGGAISFDPTQSVNDPNSKFGGYFEWMDGDNPNSLAGKNPVANLMQRRDEATAKRSIGNIELDYKFHFLPELKAVANLGYDYIESNGDDIRNTSSAHTYLSDGTNPGSKRKYEQEKTNILSDYYLNYKKELTEYNTVVDVTAGYSYQNLKNEGSEDNNIQNEAQRVFSDYFEEVNLQSYFTRANISLKDKYLLTLTYRRDGTSRFSKDNRWGDFPSAAFGWKMDQESFIKNIEAISQMKLRLGWGVTGQQNIGGSFYPATEIYLKGDDKSRYQMGGSYFYTYRAEPFNSALKWEETTTYNIGIDYGFLNNRISGTIDMYQRNTKDLLSFVALSAGSALSNEGFANVGKMENRGIEFSINATPISTEDLVWDVGFNVTYNETEITKLNNSTDPSFKGYPQGGYSGGVGNNIQIHSVGHTPFTFYVYEQVYDTNGKPIEGLYVDRNEDGIINTDDKYHHKSPAPDFYFGFNTSLSYKNWDFSLAMRGSIGNYAYNNIDSNLGYVKNLTRYDITLSNGVENLLDSEFIDGGADRYMSDYYVQDASFLKLDNVTLGYTFNNMFKDKLNLRVFASANNILTITDYDGLDPEIENGIDYNVYPRPASFVVGVSLNY